MSTQQTIEQRFILKTLVQSDLLAEIENFILDAKSRNLSPLTTLLYTRRLTEFCEGIAHKPPRDINPADIRRYLAHLADAGHNPGGQRVYFLILKTFFRWLYADEVIPADIFKRLKSPKINPLTPAAIAATTPNKFNQIAIPRR